MNNYNWRQPRCTSQSPLYYSPYPPALPYGTDKPFLRPVRRNANIVCGALLILVVVSALIAGALAPVTQFLPITSGGDALQAVLDDILSIFASVVSFVIACFFARKLLKMPRATAYPLRRPRPSIAVPSVFICLGTSIIGSYLSMIIAYVCEFLFGAVPTMPDFTAPTGAAGIVTYLISLAVVPAIFEELLFRGVIMQSLRRFGDGFALVVSAFLFAVTHGNLIQGPNAMLMGLMIGYFVLRSGSLITGMIIHFVNNLFAGLNGIAMQCMTEAQSILLNEAITIFYLVSGVVCLIIFLRIHKNMFRFPICRYPLSPGKRYFAFFITPCALVFILFMGLITLTFFTMGG